MKRDGIKRAVPAVMSLFFLFIIIAGCQTQSAIRDETILMQGSIKFYQLFISTQDEPSCIFTPTCSHYTMEAIGKYGLAGILKGADRLSRCNPVNAQYDKIFERTPDGKLIDPLERP